MRVHQAFLHVISAAALTLATACSHSSPAAQETAVPASELSSGTGQGYETTWPAVTGSELPVGEAADLTGPRDAVCPYLDGGEVEQSTGERWTGTSLDQRFDPPACVFWSYGGIPQAVVRVRTMTTHSAAVDEVNHAAPVDSTTKATQPEGWSGGRGGSSDSEYGVPGGGAVYAVYRDNVAVVVNTTQDQSVKAQRLAEETISRLGL